MALTTLCRKRDPSWPGHLLREVLHLNDLNIGGSHFQHSNFERPIETTAGCSSTQESSYWNMVMGGLFKVFVELAWGYPPKEQVTVQEVWVRVPEEVAQAKICSKQEPLAQHSLSRNSIKEREFWPSDFLLVAPLSFKNSAYLFVSVGLCVCLSVQVCQVPLSGCQRTACGIGSLLLMYGPQGSNSDHWVWQQSTFTQQASSPAAWLLFLLVII